MILQFVAIFLCAWGDFSTTFGADASVIVQRQYASAVLFGFDSGAPDERLATWLKIPEEDRLHILESKLDNLRAAAKKLGWVEFLNPKPQYVPANELMSERNSQSLLSIFKNDPSQKVRARSVELAGVLLEIASTPLNSGRAAIVPQGFLQILNQASLSPDPQFKIPALKEVVRLTSTPRNLDRAALERLSSVLATVFQSDRHFEAQEIILNGMNNVLANGLGMMTGKSADAWGEILATRYKGHFRFDPRLIPIIERSIDHIEDPEKFRFLFTYGSELIEKTYVPAQNKLNFAASLLQACKTSNGLRSKCEELIQNLPMMRRIGQAFDSVDKLGEMYRNYVKKSKAGNEPYPDKMIREIEELTSISRDGNPLSRLIARQELARYFSFHSHHLIQTHPELSTRIHDTILESLFDEDASNRKVAQIFIKSRRRDELKAALNRLKSHEFDALFSKLNEGPPSQRMELVAFISEIAQTFPDVSLLERELFLFKFMVDSPTHREKLFRLLRRSPSNDPGVLKYVMSIIQSDTSSLIERELALKYFILLKSNPGFEAARRSEVFAKKLALLFKELKNSIVPAGMDVQDYRKVLVKAWGSIHPDTAKRASDEVFGSKPQPIDHSNEVKSRILEPSMASSRSNSSESVSPPAQDTSSKGNCKGGLIAYLKRMLMGR